MGTHLKRKHCTNLITTLQRPHGFYHNLVLRRREFGYEFEKLWSLHLVKGYQLHKANNQWISVY